MLITYIIVIQLTDVIKSPRDGNIHKIHYKVDDFAKVGNSLVDIYVENAEERYNILDPIISYNFYF